MTEADQRVFELMANEEFRAAIQAETAFLVQQTMAPNLTPDQLLARWQEYHALARVIARLESQRMTVIMNHDKEFPDA